METLQTYIEKNHPEVIAEHRRATTPFYYETGVLYHPITNGFGCGVGGSDEELIIVDADYMKSGSVNLRIQSLKKPENKYSVTLSHAHTKIARVDESIAPIGNIIPNSKQHIYITVDGKDYSIYQSYGRHYETKVKTGRIIIRCEQDTPSRACGRDYQPYYELYSHFGSNWTLKHVTSYDSVAREQYTIKHNISVREFKQKVFGNPDIKFKCQLFGNL